MSRVGTEQKTNIFRMMLLLFLFSIFSVLFYCQSIGYNGAYYSDLISHINSSLRSGRAYSILSVAIRTLYILTDSLVSIALFESALVIFTYVITMKYFEKHDSHSPLTAIALSLVLVFLCSPYIPRFFPFFYKGSNITQPWHNITYIGMRPFALLAFFATVAVLDKYRESFTWKSWLCISVPLLVSASIKPNFLITYCFTLLFVLIYDFISDIRKSEINFSRFKKYVALGTVVFPSLIILLIQSKVLYSPATESGAKSGIAMVLFSSTFFKKGILFAIKRIVRDMAFPVLVVLLSAKPLSRVDKFVFLQFIFALLQAIVFKETGPRQSHGNFYWGLYMSGYILFLYSLSRYATVVFKDKRCARCVREKILLCASTVLLILHLCSGLLYFSTVFCGGDYRC